MELRAAAVRSHPRPAVENVITRAAVAQSVAVPLCGRLELLTRSLTGGQCCSFPLLFSSLGGLNANFPMNLKI